MLLNNNRPLSQSLQVLLRDILCKIISLLFTSNYGLNLLRVELFWEIRNKSSSKLSRGVLTVYVKSSMTRKNARLYVLREILNIVEDVRRNSLETRTTLRDDNWRLVETETKKRLPRFSFMSFRWHRVCSLHSSRRCHAYDIPYARGVFEYVRYRDITIELTNPPRKASLRSSERRREAKDEEEVYAGECRQKRKSRKEHAGRSSSVAKRKAFFLSSRSTHATYTCGRATPSASIFVIYKIRSAMRFFF